MTTQLEPRSVSWEAPFDPEELVLPAHRRVAPGPAPQFGDVPRWDLSAGGLAPNLNAASAHLRFEVFDDEWLPVAKTLAMAMIQPTHPVVRAAGIYRSNRP